MDCDSTRETKKISFIRTLYTKEVSLENKIFFRTRVYLSFSRLKPPATTAPPTCKIGYWFKIKIVHTDTKE